MDQLSEVVFNYADALRRGDLALAERIFHPDAVVTGQLHGVIIRSDFRSHVRRVKGMRLPRRRVSAQYKIDQIEVVGTSAFVRITERIYSKPVVTFMTFSRISGQWRINNCTFYAP